MFTSNSKRNLILGIYISDTDLCVMDCFGDLVPLSLDPHFDLLAYYITTDASIDWYNSKHVNVPYNP